MPQIPSFTGASTECLELKNNDFFILPPNLFVQSFGKPGCLEISDCICGRKEGMKEGREERRKEGREGGRKKGKEGKMACNYYFTYPWLTNKNNRFFCFLDMKENLGKQEQSTRKAWNNAQLSFILLIMQTCVSSPMSHIVPLKSQVCTGQIFLTYAKERFP